MEVYILDRNFETVSILDGYESLIWTDRYYECGDFEIYTPISSSFLEYIKPNYYLYNTESNKVMIIEDLSVVTEVAGGNHISITGRSLESILDRRISWGKHVFPDVLPSDIIYSLIKTEILSPSNTKRQIKNFVLNKTSGLSQDLVSLETFGDNLYDVIQELCETFQIGFKMELDFKTNQFVFSLYQGVNRSYSQDARPWVIFAPEFSNLVDTTYQEVNSTEKNAALIKGYEDSETDFVYMTETVTSDLSDIERREVLVNASDVEHEDEDNNPIPADIYESRLQQKGREELQKLRATKTFEGSVETHTSNFIFNKDYFLGDIVQIVTPTGLEASARITEVIRSYNDSGIDTVPTFTILE